MESQANSPLTESEACPWPLPQKGIDRFLLLLVLGLVLFGLIMVYSSSFIFAQERTGDGFFFVKKQILFTLFGFAALVVASHINYRVWSRFAYPVLGFGLFLLALVFVPGLGAKVGGAQRWLRLGFVNLQPGEVAKFIIILFVAAQLEKKRHKIEQFTAGILAHFIVPAPLFLLLLLQPDFGTVVMVVVTLFLMLYLAGAKKTYLVSMLISAVTLGSMLAMSSAYRRDRLMTFLDPWRDPAGKGFQILQSMVGFSNGNAFGVGLGNGKEKLFYLPEAHNDFIFAVIGEELGFLGVIAVVIAFFIFVMRGLKIAVDCHKKSQDLFGMLLAAGVTCVIGIQAFVNMAVVLGVMPTKGLTLPFVSYGGSALLVDLFAIGVLLSVARGPTAGIRFER